MPPIIVSKRCKRCGQCAQVCQCDVFFGSKKAEVPQITYPEECWHCNACVEVCGTRGAIRLRIPLPMMILYKGGRTRKEGKR
jgi:NAD-dependent dihydropyrimidine dehydrogenase PreA subunit